MDAVIWVTLTACEKLSRDALTTFLRSSTLAAQSSQSWLMPDHSLHLKGVEMPLITIVLVLIVVGVLLWLINTYIPMDRKIKNILNIVVVVVVVIWLLQAFGLIGSLSKVRIR